MRNKHKGVVTKQAQIKVDSLTREVKFIKLTMPVITIRLKLLFHCNVLKKYTI